MLRHLMKNKVNVIRKTYAPDTSGGQVETPSTVYTAQPASVQPVSSAWKFYYATKNIEITHTVFFDSQLTILNGDEISFSGKTLRVEGVRDLISLGRVLVVDALQIMGG